MMQTETINLRQNTIVNMGLVFVIYILAVGFLFYTYFSTSTFGAAPNRHAAAEAKVVAFGILLIAGPVFMVLVKIFDGKKRVVTRASTMAWGSLAIMALLAVIYPYPLVFVDAPEKSGPNGLIHVVNPALEIGTGVLFLLMFLPLIYPLHKGSAFRFLLNVAALALSTLIVFYLYEDIPFYAG